MRQTPVCLGKPVQSAAKPRAITASGDEWLMSRIPQTGATCFQRPRDPRKLEVGV